MMRAAKHSGAGNQMRGRVRHTSMGAPGRRRVRLPPELKPGQARCPVCRNACSVTGRGFLRRHRDLYGLDCYNVAPLEAES